jgi:chemotaxis protein histidine kinase CheA
MAVKTVSTFTLPDEYQRQASEARRRRRMAEMLAQQAYQPGDIQNAPIPRGAPLVQGLQAFLAARAARKADEAEEGAMKAQTQEARDFLNTLTRPREDFDKTMNLGQVLQIGTPELVDGQLRYPDISTEAPNLKMIPQEGPRVQLGRKPEDDQVYMPAAVSRFTATGRETDPQRMAAMLANPEFKSSFTDEQLLEKRRNLALEGMLTSQNPLVQKIAQMQYGAMQPKQLEIGAVNLADLTPASAKKFAASGDPKDIEYAVEPTSTSGLTTLSKLYTERNALIAKNPNDPFIKTIDAAIAKEITPARGATVNVTNRYGAPMAVEDAQGNPVLIQPSQTGGPPSVVKGFTPPPSKGTAPTVSEATSGWNISRIVNAANAIQLAIEKDPSAIKPSAQEFAAGMVSDEAANAVRSPQRQIVVGEQSDLLDAYLTLATGAAYTDPQFINAKRGLTPTLTDDAAAIERKSKKLLELIPQAKARTGAAWTPELEKAVRDLAASFNKSAPPSTVNPAKGWGKAQQVR